MARLRYNGLTAELGADLLTADTTITFTAALTSAAGAVPTITGTDYIPLVVLGSTGGAREIVHLTAYTSGATTGTVTRAQESTTADDHATGLTVVNGLTVADTTEFATGSAVLRARAGMTTNPNVTTATVTTLALDAESFDNGTLHSTTVNNSRITLAQAGVWLVMGTVSYSAQSGGRRIAIVNVNGSEVARDTSFPTSSAIASASVTVPVVTTGTTDYVELAAYQDSGSTVTARLNETFLAVVYLGP